MEDQSKLTYNKPSIVDLIGKPFVYGGRGPDNYDCWGLLMEVYRRAYGKDLPDFRSPGNVREAALLMARYLQTWEEVAPGPGTGVMLSVEGVGAHVAFQLDDMRMIHTLEANGAMTERVDVWSRGGKVLGHYRYAG